MAKSKDSWPLGTRIEIEWVDSCTGTGWAPIEQYRIESVPTLCRTIGYLLESTPEKVVVVQSMSSDTKRLDSSMAIPRKCVRKILKIKGLEA